MPYDPARHHRRSIRLRGYDYTLAGAYYVTIVTQDRAHLFGDVVDGLMQLNDAGRMAQQEWFNLCERFPAIDLDAFIVMPNHIHGVIVINYPDVVGAGLVPAHDGDAPDADAPDADAPDADAPQRAGTRPAPTVAAANVVGAGLVPALAPAAAAADPDGNDRLAGDGWVGDGGDGDDGNGDASQRAGTRPAPTPMAMVALGDIVGAFKSITTHAYIQGVRRDGWPGFNGRLWQRNYYEHIIRDDPSLQRIRHYIESNPEQWAADRENPAAKSQGKAP